MFRINISISIFDDPDNAGFDVFRSDPEDLLQLEDDALVALVNPGHGNVVGRQDA
jgi:hypothetical protein